MRKTKRTQKEFLTRKFKSTLLIIFVIFITLGFSIALQSTFAQWLNPTGTPPAGNLPPEPINVSSSTQSKQGNLNIGGSNLTFNQSTNPDFYLDANRGVQLRVGLDNAGSSTFSINNGANSRVFSVDETGKVTTGKFTLDKVTPPAVCPPGLNFQWTGSGWTCDYPTFAGVVAVCGDGQCLNGETCTNCAADCGTCAPNSCGDGTCSATESCNSCPADCGSCSTANCGDGSCNGTENCSSCPADCGACAPVCGDSSCNGTETCSTCPSDCGVCAQICGNGSCLGSETCSSCPADCGACAPVCGDSSCNGTETCSTCAADCGICGADGLACTTNDDCANKNCWQGFCRTVSCSATDCNYGTYEFVSSSPNGCNNCTDTYWNCIGNGGTAKANNCSSCL